VAKEEGFLAQHGISSVNLLHVTSLPTLTASLTHGQVDMAVQTPIYVSTVNKAGADVRFFAPGLANNLSWIVPKNSTLPVATANDWQTTVRAWRGKTIGVPTLKGALEFFTRYLASQAGLKPSDYTIIAVGAGPQGFAALKAGAADILVSDGFAATQAAQQGIGKAVIDFATGQGPAMFSHTLLTGFVASASALQQNRARYAAFTAALQQGIAYTLDPANEARVEQIIAKDIQVPSAAAKALYAGQVAGSFNVRLNPQTINSTATKYVQYGIMPGPTPSYAALAVNLGA
jgi:ABC-type nitrate/sulfonate/bicarbonate transport system substrate-binding protein